MLETVFVSESISRIWTTQVEFLSVQLYAKSRFVGQLHIPVVRERFVFEQIPKETHNFVCLWRHDEEFCNGTTGETNLQMIGIHRGSVRNNRDVESTCQSYNASSFGHTPTPFGTL